MKPRIKFGTSGRKNNHSKQQEKKRIQKNEISVNSLWDPEVEEKEQEIGNLFEKIMKENFPNLVKEIDMQDQQAQKVPKRQKGPFQDTS